MGRIWSQDKAYSTPFTKSRLTKPPQAEVFEVSLEEVHHRANAAAPKSPSLRLDLRHVPFWSSEQLGIGRPEAGRLHKNANFERYRRAGNNMENTREGAKEKLCANHLRSIVCTYRTSKPANAMMRQPAERNARSNAPMQGSAADIIKRAMIKTMHNWLAETDLRRENESMQVHDELHLRSR